MSEDPPEGLSLPAPERGWTDEASDEPTVDLLGALQRSLKKARQPRLEQDGPNGVGLIVNAGNRAGKASAVRVYASGGMTFEHNPLTGDTIVSGVLIYEPLAPGKIRLSSKRRGGSAEIGANG